MWFQNRRMKHKRQTISKTDDEDNKDSLKDDDDSQPCSEYIPDFSISCYAFLAQLTRIYFICLLFTSSKIHIYICLHPALLVPSAFTHNQKLFSRQTRAPRSRARAANCRRTTFPTPRRTRAATTTIRPVRPTTTTNTPPAAAQPARATTAPIIIRAASAETVSSILYGFGCGIG